MDIPVIAGTVLALVIVVFVLAYARGHASHHSHAWNKHDSAATVPDASTIASSTSSLDYGSPSTIDSNGQEASCSSDNGSSSDSNASDDSFSCDGGGDSSGDGGGSDGGGSD